MIALEEKYAPYRHSAVAPESLREPEHLARDPFGRIPVMDHDGFRLYETQVMLRYIDRALRTPPLTPREPKSAARMDLLMNINDSYLFRGVVSDIGFPGVIAPRLTGSKSDEDGIAVDEPKSQTMFKELARQLGDSDFFVGNSITLADILLAPHLDLFRESPEWPGLTEITPNLCAWLDRMNQRPWLDKCDRTRPPATGL
jgi:glutathione S-transferase